MFGKDTSYCDSFGFISDLDDQHMTKTALGKAHCVALNSRGEVFTFGLNNKGQCGRIFAKASDEECESRRKKPPAEAEIDPYSAEFKTKVESTGQKSSEAKVVSTHMPPCPHASPNCYPCAMKEKPRGGAADKDLAASSDAASDTPRIVSLPPAKLGLPTAASPVVQISCGLHHAVLLTLTGEVFTFGSNQYGQLGTGDLQPVYCPVPVKIKGKIVQVAAGSNHTVLLTATGNVFTFGKYHKGQLGRLPSEIRQEQGQSEQLFAQNIVLTGQKFFWNCHPIEVTAIGPNQGKKASWIGASGDQTFIKTDESLVNAAMLSKFHVAADKNTICRFTVAMLAFKLKKTVFFSADPQFAIFDQVHCNQSQGWHLQGPHCRSISLHQHRS